MGRLRVTNLGALHSLVINWTPYETQGPSSPGGSFTIRVPVEEVSALRRLLPTDGGDPSVTIFLNGGVSFPPLIFTEGGAGDFIAVLARYADLVEDPSDATMINVRDKSDPLAGAGGTKLVPSASSPGGVAPAAKDSQGSSWFKDASWAIAGGLSKVSRIARDTTSQMWANTSKGPGGGSTKGRAGASALASSRTSGAGASSKGSSSSSLSSSSASSSSSSSSSTTTTTTTTKTSSSSSSSSAPSSSLSGRVSGSASAAGGPRKSHLGGGRGAVAAAQALNHGLLDSGSGRNSGPAPLDAHASLTDVDYADLIALTTPSWTVRGERPAVPAPLKEPKTSLWESEDLPLCGITGVAPGVSNNRAVEIATPPGNRLVRTVSPQGETAEISSRDESGCGERVTLADRFTAASDSTSTSADANAGADANANANANADTDANANADSNAEAALPDAEAGTAPESVDSDRDGARGKEESPSSADPALAL